MGAPAGAVALPVLGLTVLRRVPLGRALGLPVLGAAPGLAAAALLAPGPASTVGLPAVVPALAAGGVLVGAAAARAAGRRPLPAGGARRLRP